MSRHRGGSNLAPVSPRVSPVFEQPARSIWYGYEVIQAVELDDPIRPIQWAHLVWQKDREVERRLMENPFWYRDILDHTEADAKGCLNWKGGTRNGYGVLQQYRVHRIVWLAERGPLALGWVPDHTCKTRVCQNINHLDAVPVRVNSQRQTNDRYFQKSPDPKTQKPYKKRTHSPLVETIRDSLAHR